MKKPVFILLISSLLLGFKDHTVVKKYILIRDVMKYIPGITEKVKVAEVNLADVGQLNEPLRALAAYYSAFGGTDCDGDTCSLTSALGLGIQGSDKQKALIKKWFGNDPAANLLIANDCYQSPSSSSDFSYYNSLIFDDKNDTVTVSYSLGTYDHGSSATKIGHDKVAITNDKIVVLSRK